jgi:hypothetical protein
MMNRDAKDQYFRTRDDNGEDILCPVAAVSDRNILTDKELEECVDAATAGRYAGTITVEG